MSEPTDNIYHHDFTSKKEEGEAPHIEQILGQTKESQTLDGHVIPFAVEGAHGKEYDFIETIRNYEKIINFLKSLRSSASSTTKSIRRETISGMSAIELSRAINESTQNDWKMRPAYFTALVHKFNNDVIAKHIGGESGVHNDLPSE